MEATSLHGPTTLKMEAAWPSETLVSYHITTWGCTYIYHVCMNDEIHKDVMKTGRQVESNRKI
jgi:hypothetical protein